MQQMVSDFRKQLADGEVPRQYSLFSEICEFLSSTLGRPVDLEAVFTVVDSIVRWAPERMGIAALYHAARATGLGGRGTAPNKFPVVTPPGDTDSALSLQQNFERFVRESCQIREGQSESIAAVYQALFNNIASVFGGYQDSTGQYTHGDWPLFTTNYDAILEHFWMDIAQVSLNTGFSYNSVARMEVSSPERLREMSGLRLFKLHGSITWLLDSRWGLTEQRVPPHEMKTYTGRKFLGQVMLYPIEEKELYVEPYLTMYQMLNRELAMAGRWLVIGYSFGDRIVRDIFLRNATKETRMVLVHPHANLVAEGLKGFKGKIRPFEKRFGGSDYVEVARELRDLVRQA